MIDPEIMEAFLLESNEHLAAAEDDILAIEKGEIKSDTINHLFRAVHTIKGSSSFIGLQKVMKLAHAFENIVGRMREHSLNMDPAIAEVLLKSVDKLRQLINNAEDNSIDIDREVEELEAILREGGGGDEEVLRIDVEKRDKKDTGTAVSGQEKQGDPNTVEDKEHAADPGAVSEDGSQSEVRFVPTAAGETLPVESTVRISLSLLDRLMNLASELVLVRNQNRQAVESGDMEQLVTISQRLNVVTSELQASIMQTRMRPIGSVFTKFKRTVRDLARQVKKEVDLLTVGSEVELDKNIIEAISDPLTHLIRNSIDHGIEDPAQRTRSGKPARGQIVLSAFHQAGHVNIEVRDDGRGMDPEEIKKAAEKRGNLTKEQIEAMAERDPFSLIFTPGFSMADRVTDISGRGVGMDVVKETFGKMGGVIDISSQIGHGTTISVKLPLTLAIIPTLIVAAEDTCFAIPQINIDEVVWLHGDDLYQALKIVDDQEVYWLRGKLLPILRLSKVIGMTRTYPDPRNGTKMEDRRSETPDQRISALDDEVDVDMRKGPQERRVSPLNSAYIVVLILGNERFGILVDSIIDTEEIVVKSLHDQLNACRAFAGTTVLGDGRIAMILDVAALVELGSLRLTNVDMTVPSIKSSSEDRQTVLLFDIGGRETFAVPLPLITRVEEIRSSQIQVASGREYLDFRGFIMPLVRIDTALPDFKGKYDDDVLYVIIPKSRRAFGVLASSIMDTIRINREIDSQTIGHKGIIGSALIDGSLTLFVDLFEIMTLIEPGWFKEEETTEKRVMRVLLLEDSAFYASLIVPYLRAEGIEVVHVKNGEEGLKELSSAKIDLVVSDIEMPVMGGLEFARIVRSDDAVGKMPMLAISSLQDDSLESEAISSGFDEFHSKFELGTLLEKLSALCSGKEQLSRES